MKCFYIRVISILQARMEFQQDNSYVFYSPLRNEMVHQFGTLVLSSWAYQIYSFQTSSYQSYVEIVYVDGRREQIQYPFSNHMIIDDGGGNMEEEKENEEEEEEEEEEPHPVTPQPQANNEDDAETDNESDNEEEEPDEEEQPDNEPDNEGDEEAEEPNDMFIVEF